MYQFCKEATTNHTAVFYNGNYYGSYAYDELYRFLYEGINRLSRTPSLKSEQREIAHNFDRCLTVYPASNYWIVFNHGGSITSGLSHNEMAYHVVEYIKTGKSPWQSLPFGEFIRGEMKHVVATAQLNI